MKLKAISLVLFCLFFVDAHAEKASNGSEKLFQAPAGVFDLTPTLAYRDTKFNFDPAGYIEQSGPFLKVKAEYGFNENLSAGAIIAYDSLSGKSGGTATGDYKGFEDPSIFLNARFNTGGGSLRFGGMFNFAIQKDKIDSNLNSTPSTGGLHLEPFVGYEMYFAQHTIGARVGYNFLLGDRKFTDGSSGTDVDKTVSGGSVLKTLIFYELAFDPMATFGVSFEMDSTSNSTYKTDSTGSSTTGSGNTLWDLAIYVPIQPVSDVTLLPQFEYGQYSALPSGYSSISQWTLQFGARFAF